MTNLLEYYKNTYHGEAVDDAAFPRLQARAEDVLQVYTLGRLNAVPEGMQECVWKAMCAQIEYLSIMGVESAIIGEGGGGFTVGNVSVNGREGGAQDSTGVCAAALRHLFPTGLLFRGCDVC